MDTTGFKVIERPRAACLLRALEGVKQPREWHQEGDAHAHSVLAATSLVSLPGFERCSLTARTILVAATLLHDVGKAKLGDVPPDQEFKEARHAAIGAKLVEEALTADGWEEGYVEDVVALVRHHMVPANYHLQDSPNEVILAASKDCSLPMLGLVAQADVLGSISEHNSNSMVRIIAFIETAMMLGCYKHYY
jgi:hypothetical protein